MADQRADHDRGTAARPRPREPASGPCQPASGPCSRRCHRMNERDHSVPAAPAQGGPWVEIDRPVTRIDEICLGMTNVAAAAPEVVTLCHGVTIEPGWDPGGRDRRSDPVHVPGPYYVGCARLRRPLCAAGTGTRSRRDGGSLAGHPGRPLAALRPWRARVPLLRAARLRPAAPAAPAADAGRTQRRPLPVQPARAPPAQAGRASGRPGPAPTTRPSRATWPSESATSATRLGPAPPATAGKRVVFVIDVRNQGSESMKGWDLVVGAVPTE